LLRLRDACQGTAGALDSAAEIAPDFGRLIERNHALLQKIELFGLPAKTQVVRWLDVGAQLRLVESPLDIANAVQTRLLKLDAQDPSSRAWIFTSATLGDDAKLKWFTEPCGLESAEILKVGSPFDYPMQAAVYVPRHLPKPADMNHSAQVAALVTKSAPIIGGRTLVLTTTLRALRTISEALQTHFCDGEDLEILVQGARPKRELMARFRQGDSDGNGRRRGCILVASASFWEGVDLPGDALQLVIIDKLPFPPPNDPLVEARSSRLEEMGRSPFKDYFLPEAAVALKQGAGRLIRRESDRGILVVCDTRLVTMGYGRRLLAALPPMRKIDSEGDYFDALNQLTRASTRDPGST
jgi:ATP-dependent DNA helicase DinG